MTISSVQGFLTLVLGVVGLIILALVFVASAVLVFQGVRKFRKFPISWRDQRREQAGEIVGAIIVCAVCGLEFFTFGALLGFFPWVNDGVRTLGIVVFALIVLVAISSGDPSSNSGGTPGPQTF